MIKGFLFFFFFFTIDGLIILSVWSAKLGLLSLVFCDVYWCGVEYPVVIESMLLDLEANSSQWNRLQGLGGPQKCLKHVATWFGYTDIVFPSVWITNLKFATDLWPWWIIKYNLESSTINRGMIFYDECWILRAKLFQTKAFQYNYVILSHLLKKNFIIENTYTYLQV